MESIETINECEFLDFFNSKTFHANCFNDDCSLNENYNSFKSTGIIASIFEDNLDSTYLANKKLIYTKRMGVPCKTYYKINENEILRLCENTKVKFQKDITNQVAEKLKNKMSKKLISSYENFEELDYENLNINNNK